MASHDRKNDSSQFKDKLELTYMKYNTYFMKFMTVYPIDRNASVPKKIIFTFWRYFAIFALIIYPIQATIDLAGRKDIGLVDLAPHILHIVLYISGSVRTGYFYYREERIRFLVEKMNWMFKYESDVPIDAHSMKTFNKIAKIITIYWQINLLFTAQFISLLPIAFFDKTGYVLPFPAWYPWNWEDHFKFTYATQVLCNFFLGFTYANPDSFYVASVLLLAKQWDILGSNLKNYLYKALVDYGMPLEKVIAFSKCYNYLGREKNPDDPNLKKESQKELEAKKMLEAEVTEVVRSHAFHKVLHNTFVNYIKEHKALIEFSEQLQDFMSPFIFMILGFGTSYLIFIVFCATTTTNRSTIMGLSQYFFTAWTQSLFFTFFGHILLTKSENAQYCLYESPWYICTEKFKSVFFFTFLRCKNPQMLSGANFFIMRLDIFMTIQRTVFSFYTLLRQMNTKNAKRISA